MEAAPQGDEEKAEMKATRNTIKKLTLVRNTVRDLRVKSDIRAGTSVSACTTRWGITQTSTTEM